MEEEKERALISFVYLVILFGSLIMGILGLISQFFDYLTPVSCVITSIMFRIFSEFSESYDLNTYYDGSTKNVVSMIMITGTSIIMIGFILILRSTYAYIIPLFFVIGTNMIISPYIPIIINDINKYLYPNAEFNEEYSNV